MQKIKYYNTIKENTMINDFVVAGLGMATVFVVLICIIFICNITGSIFSRIADKPSDDADSSDKPDSVSDNGSALVNSQSTGMTVPSAHYVKAKLENRGAFIAAVSAVIAEDIGCDVSRIRILSVRERADTIKNRGELCAAISSVIALETGADAVRIHSIRRRENRGELCAAISSVIALDTGADAVRIHSIRRV